MQYSDHEPNITNTNTNTKPNDACIFFKKQNVQLCLHEDENDYDINGLQISSCANDADNVLSPNSLLADGTSSFDMDAFMANFDKMGELHKECEMQIKTLMQYYTELSVKELHKICEYYEIKVTQKSKKADIIYLIALFETEYTNAETVFKRHQFWQYMEELKKDKYMRRYVVW